LQPRLERLDEGTALFSWRTTWRSSAV
jgi:hypothetical protein